MQLAVGSHRSGGDSWLGNEWQPEGVIEEEAAITSTRACVGPASRNPRERRLPTATRSSPSTTDSANLPWGNLSNTPFRKFKRWNHEGGIATPLIAYWPRVIAQGGAITHQMGHLIDVMATCKEYAVVNDGWFVVEPPDSPNQGTTFVNHATTGRSGRLSKMSYLPARNSE